MHDVMPLEEEEFTEHSDRRLIEYLPERLRETKELNVLTWKAQQPESDLLWKAIGQIWDEQFVETAGDFALSRWENMMNLPPENTIEARRAAIISRLSEIPPFNLSALIEMLIEICGPGNVNVYLVYDEYRLTISLAPDMPLPAIYSLLRRHVPANIRVDAGFFATHISLRGRRHIDLAEFTHLQIREGN